MENKFTDINTTDQAWSMMRITLDKKMPVQRKRRAIWWIPVGLGLLAIVSLTYVFSLGDADANTQPHEKIQNTTESRPIANKEVKPPSSKINQTESTIKKETKSIENKKSNTKSTPNLRPNKKNKAITKIAAPLKTLVQNQVNTKQNTLLYNRIQAKRNATALDKKDAQEPIVNQGPSKSTSSQKSVDAIENKLISSELSAAERPASFIVDPLPTLNNLQFDWEAEPNVEALLPKNNKWDFGLKTVVLSDVKFDIPTLLIEGQIIRKFGSRWSINSGLGIKSQSLKSTVITFDGEGAFDLSSVGISANSIEFDIKDNIGGPAFPTFGVGRKSNPSRSFNFLYIPIGVKYNFKGRWSIAAGAQFNFVELSRKSSIMLRFGTQSNTSNNSFNSTLVDNRNFNHFSYYLSMNYKLGKKASLLVQYQGNRNRFSGENPRIDAHQFGLGMHRQF